MFCFCKKSAFPVLLRPPDSGSILFILNDIIFEDGRNKDEKKEVNF